MDKYGVVTDSEATKVASKSGDPCPGCGGRNVDYKGSTPHCPNCGTQPWEKRRGSTQEEEGHSHR